VVDCFILMTAFIHIRSIAGILKQMFWRWRQDIQKHVGFRIRQLRETIAMLLGILVFKKIPHTRKVPSSFICICVKSGGGWGPPCGKTGKPIVATGLQLSVHGLILAYSSIFILTGAVLDVLLCFLKAGNLQILKSHAGNRLTCIWSSLLPAVV